MIPVIISVLFFISCGVIGSAFLVLLRPTLPLLRLWLLGPAMGISTIVLCVTILNQLGWPISTFASPLLFALLCASGWVFWRNRRPFCYRALWPFCFCLGISLLLSGWPCFIGGDHWIGYGNDDMLGYVFETVRQNENGFYDVPQIKDLLGRDYTQYYWFFHVPGMVRFGSENLVGFVSAVTSIGPLRAFFPTLLALSLTQITGAAGLILTHGRFRKTALTAAVLLTFSPLLGLSVALQVIAQVGGLGIMILLYTLACERFSETRPTIFRLTRRGLAVAVPASALCITYPELLPFCVIGLGLTHFFHLRKTNYIRNFFATFAVASFFVFIFLRQNILTALTTLLFHAGKGTSGGLEVSRAFDVALLPSALPALLGLTNLYTPPGEPLLSFSIAGAITMLAVLLWRLLLASRYRHPAILLLLVMLSVGVVLHLTNNAFGVYKLSMFVQPVLAAGGALALTPKKRFQWIPVMALPLLLAPVYTHYILLHSGLTGFGSLLAERSAEPVPRAFLSGNAKFVANTPSVAYDKLLAVLLRGKGLEFANRDGITGALSWGAEKYRALSPLLRNRLAPESAAVDDFERYFRENVYRRNHVLGARFTSAHFLGSSSEEIWISVRSPFSPFNRFHHPPPSLIPHPVFLFQSAAMLKNHLVFLNTNRSNDYYSFLPEAGGTISYFPDEPDFFLPQYRFYGIGRFLLFEVKNPTSTVRLRLAVTRTLMGKGRHQLPANVLIAGEKIDELSMRGDGAANLFSKPLRPFFYEGKFYLAIDLMTNPSRFGESKQNLMALYGASATLDWRNLVAFGRDVSVVSEEDYANLPPSLAIEAFPDDLVANPGLEFSGIYEDGWVSPQAMIRLGSVSAAANLRIRAEIPLLPPMGSLQRELVVRIDGEIAAKVPLAPGAVSLQLPIKNAERRHLIEFSSDAHFVLGPGDDRPVIFRLSQIRLE